MFKIIRIFLIMMFAIMVTGVSCAKNLSTTPSDGIDDECQWSDILPESRPSDFNLLFEYGYGSVNKNALNTFNGTYTKDLGTDPPITIDFSLSDEEMDEIYQKMLEINFFCYPDKFVIPVHAGETVTAETPYQGYYFKVECLQQVKILKWEDNIKKDDDDAISLRKLISFIRNIIESKVEYQELPPYSGIHI